MGIPLYPAPGKRLELRIGVVLDDWMTSAWIEQVLRGVSALDGPRIVAVILDTDCRYAFRRSERRSAVFDAYERRDAARLRKADSPFIPRDVKPLMSSCETIELRRRTGSADPSLDPDTSTAIAACGLDVILDLSARATPSELSALARYGLWRCHFGDSRTYRGGPPLYWELYEGNPESTVELHVLRADPERTEVVYRSPGATNFLSLELNRRHAYWKAAAFMPRLLRRLQADGEAVLDGTPLPDNVPSRAKPTLAQSFVFMMRLASRRFRAALLRRRYEEHWIVGYRYTDTLLDPDRPLLDAMQVLPSPRGHFYADPCVITRDGRDFVFIEDLDYARNLGTIACVELTPSGPVAPARTVLELKTHLSYPQVFEWQGQVYMIPESAEARVVRLYRAVEFPWRWEPVADLIRGYHTADATVIRHQNRWYLFTVIPESGGGIHEELFLFHAQNLEGPWEPHPLNPVVSDVRRARCAGPIFRRGERLIRPAQDCTINYGRAVVFNEILELTPETYRERALGRLDADWYPHLHGCHTYDTNGRLEMVDGKSHARKSAVRLRES